jgi:hypothetical protein
VTGLTVLLPCHEAPDRVLHTAEALRPVADEVVVCCDARMPAAEVRHLAGRRGLRVVRVDGLAPIERSLELVHGLARTPWSLRLDADEVLDGRLLAALPELLRAPVTHWLLPRRWAWPDGNRALDAAPWWPDLQVRLLRSDPGLVRWPARLHEPPRAAGPAGIAPGAILHADLLAPVAARRAKVARYAAAMGGDPEGFNAGMYLPEDLPAPPSTTALDPGDRRALDALVAPGPRPPARVPRLPRRVRTLRVAAAPVKVPAEDLPVATAAPGLALVTVRHPGGPAWPAGPRAPRLQVEHADGAARELELPGPVGPGEAVTVPVAGEVPVRARLLAPPPPLEPLGDPAGPAPH